MELNILQRIAAIKKQAKLIKTGTDLAFVDKYATYDDVLRAVKELMDKYEILALPIDTDKEPTLAGSKILVTQLFDIVVTEDFDCFETSVTILVDSKNDSTAIMTLAKKALYMQLFDLSDIDNDTPKAPETEGQKAIKNLKKTTK